MIRKTVLTCSSFVILIAIFAFSLTPSAFAQSRTNSVWQDAGDLSPVTVIPYVWAGRDNLFFDFEAANFSPIQSITYNLEYDTDEHAIERGAEGNFDPNLDPPTGYYRGRPYHRKHIVLGTCSHGVCTYHQNPRNVRMTTTTTMKYGPLAKYTQVLKFPDDQF